MEIGTLIVFEVLCPAGTVDVWDMNKPYKALSNCLTLEAQLDLLVLPPSWFRSTK